MGENTQKVGAWVHIFLILSVLVIVVGVVALRMSKQRRQVKQGQEAQRQIKLNVIGAIASNANTFVGLYEPLHMIAEKRLSHSQAVFSDWNTRIENVGKDSDFHQYWKEHFSGFSDWHVEEAAEKARELLTLIKKAGISRSNETKVVVSVDAFKRYTAKDGVKLETGAEAMVELPYWSYNEKILEKGVIFDARGGV